MSTSSNDPSAQDPKPAPDLTEQSRSDVDVQPGKVDRRQVTMLAGKALPYLAALAAANVAQSGAPVSAAEGDRAYLEALLHGSWTEPPDLNARRPEAEATPLADELDGAGAFNDSYNPNPTPYHDRSYADSNFGDRTK